MTLMVGQTPSGKLIPLRVGEDGSVSTVGGGGGSGSAQELPISPGGAVIGPSAALVVALHPDSTPVEVRVIDAVRSPAALAAGADQVVAVTNLGTLETLLGAVRTQAEATADALDTPTSALLAELESIDTAQATDATLQQVASKLDALRTQLPPSLISGALAVTGTVSLAPGTTVTLASGTQVQVSNTVAVETELSASGNLATEAKQDATITALSTKASEATQAQVLAAVDTLEAGQATGNASLSSIATSSAATAGRLPTQLGAQGGLKVEPQGTTTVAGAMTVTNTVAVDTELSAAGPLATQGSVDELEGYLNDAETLLTAIRDRLPALLGQQAAAASLSVVLATGTTITTTSTTGERARTPVQVLAALTTTASQLSAASSASSSAGWEIFNPSTSGVTILVGDSANQVREVAPGDRMGIPSTTLTGWFAKTSAGTANVVLTGAI